MEILDIVDLNDKVIGKAPKDVVYKDLLPHRIVRVVIFNKKGLVALQLRSKKVNLFPGYWCSTASGHVRSGETYKKAASRECQEEIGITPNLTFLYKDIHTLEEGLVKIIATFIGYSEGPFEIDPEEVEKVDFFNPKDIKRMLKAGKNLHPELVLLLKNHPDIL
jgi:isopentenyl-diphosphate Delta-isomerase